MDKSILGCLLEDDDACFKKYLIDFLKASTTVDDLTDYSFLPIFFDSWLLSAREKSNFLLYKIYRPGKLVYDITTYIIVPDKGDKVYYVTLNNVYHRDKNAQNQAIQENLLKVNMPDRRKKSSVGSGLYEQSFKKYTDLTLKHIYGEKEQQRGANVALLLEENRVRENLENLIREGKNIRYVGVANVHGELDVKSGSKLHQILKKITKISDRRQEARIVAAKIKTALAMKTDQFILNTVEPIKLTSSLNTKPTPATALFDEQFNSQLNAIISQHARLSKARTQYEVNLIAAVIGYIAAKNLKVIDIRKAEIKRKARIWYAFNNVNNYLYYDKELKQAMTKSNPGLAHVVELKFIDQTINKGMQNAYDFTNYKRYMRNFNAYYDVMRVERVAIIASPLNYQTTVVKDICPETLPFKAKVSLVKLLLNKDFSAFEHNLNLFAQSVLNIKDIKKRRPEFLPAFILGLLFEGVLGKDVNFYVQPSNYDEYGFLMESKAPKELILLMSIENINQINTILSKFDLQISLLSEKNNISKIKIVQLNVVDDKFNLIVSEKKIEPILTFKSAEARHFTQNTLEMQVHKTFFKVLQNLAYSLDQNRAVVDLNKIIDRLFLQNWDYIFPLQRSTGNYICAGVLGLIAGSWQNFFTLESDGQASNLDSFYLNIAPRFKTSRKPTLQFEPLGLTFVFPWNQNGDLKSLREITRQEILKRNTHLNSEEHKLKKIFRNQKSTYLFIAASKTNVLVQLVPEDNAIITSSLAEDVTKLREEATRNVQIKQLCKTSSFKKCKKIIQQKRAGYNLQARKAANEEIIKSLKEIIHYPNLHTILDTSTNSVMRDLREAGVNLPLINLLKVQADRNFDTVGLNLIEQYYKYISGDAQQSYLIEHKEQVKFKLKKWFNFFTLYSTFDNVVTIRQNAGPSTALINQGLVANDLFHTMASFLSQRAIDYKTFRAYGYHLQKIANNPLSRLISFAGNQYQLISGFDAIRKSMLYDDSLEFTTLYWTGRSFMVNLALIIKRLRKLNLTFAFIDILISSLAHVGESISAMHTVASYLPLSIAQRTGVFFDYLLGNGLAKFENKIAIKYQLMHLKHDIQDYLKKQPTIRGVTVFADSIEMQQYYAKLPLIGKNSLAYPETFFLPSIGDNYFPGNISFVLKIGSIREKPRFNLSAITTQQFLPTHDDYLGLTTNTLVCSLAVSFSCNVNLEVKFLKRGVLWFLETLQGTHCQLLNGTKITGDEDACQLRKQLENDAIQRKIKVIDNSDLIIPTQQQVEDRFAWISLPLGDLTSIWFHCKTVASNISTDGFAPTRQLGDKICSEKFMFRNNSPFSLIDTKKPEYGPILYINAPIQVSKNTKTRQLQVMQSNPAIIHVGIGYVTFNGSLDFYNIFILNNASDIEENNADPKISGYLQGGSKNDTLLVGSFTGALPLTFVEQFKNLANATLNAINIESYFGSAKVEEDFKIDYCGLRSIDAKGSQGQPDKFMPSDQLRCKETDLEQRIVYAGDIHYLPSHKPIIMQLNSSNFDKPAFLVKSSIPTLYRPTVLLNVSLINLTISDFNEPEDLFSDKYAYRITTDQGNTLLITNSYDPLFLTLEEISFSVQPRSLVDIQNLIYQQVLLLNLTKPNKELINTTAPLESISIVFNQSKSPLAKSPFMNFLLLKEQFSKYLNKFSWQMKSFSSTNSVLETMIFGSYFSDVFTTELDHFSYWFHGGEGSDEYIILASETGWRHYPDSVVINNHALFYNAGYGQDILNISPLEHYNPELKLIEIEPLEERKLGLNNQTLVILIEYDSFGEEERSRSKIFLQEYRSNEDFRHLLLKLSNYPNANVLYRIDVDNQKLVPECYYKEPLIDANGLPIPISKFPSISLAKEKHHAVNFLNEANLRSERLYSLNLTELKSEDINATILPAPLIFEKHKISQAEMYPITSEDQINFKSLYETDREQREIFCGDIIYINNYAPVIFQLKNINFDRPVFLVKTRISSYSQIIVLDVSFWSLTVSKLEKAEHMQSGPVYQISIDPGKVFLSTNATDDLIYITREQIAFYLTTSFVDKQQKQKITEEFFKSLSQAGSGLSFVNLNTENITFAAHYINHNFVPQKKLRAMMSKMAFTFTWQLQSFVINNLLDGIMQLGSVYNDTFVTYEMDLSYEFYGSEGVDLYKVLPTEKKGNNTDRVLINNQALIHNQGYGQDILDLTNFRFLRPKLSLKQPDDWERLNYGVDNKSIVLQVNYANLATKINNTVRVCISEYLDELKDNVLADNQDSRHLLVKLSSIFNGLDVLYDIDVEKKQLVPVQIIRNVLGDENENGVNISNLATYFQTIPLVGSSKVTPPDDSVFVSDLHTHALHIPESKAVDLITKEAQTSVQNDKGNSYGVYVGGVTFLLSTFVVITAYLRRPLTAAAYSPLALNPLRTTTATAFLANMAEAVDSYLSPKQVTTQISIEHKLHHQAAAVSLKTQVNSWINQGFKCAKNFLSKIRQESRLDIPSRKLTGEGKAPLPLKLEPQTFAKLHNKTIYSHNSHFFRGLPDVLENRDTPNAQTKPLLKTVDYLQAIDSNNLLFWSVVTSMVTSYKLGSMPMPLEEQDPLFNYERLHFQAQQKRGFISVDETGKKHCAVERSRKAAC